MSRVDFALSDLQTELVATVRRFATERLAPAYRAGDLDARIDRDVVAEMGRMGMIGCELPEAVGGAGVDCVTSGLVLEQIAHGDFNVAYVNLLASLCGQILVEHAAPDVQQEWLPRITAGTALIAIALTEPEAGSDAAHLRLTARRYGSDYLLDGEKASISFADQADVAVVFARTGPDPGARGISAFAVDLGAPGITRTATDDLGTRRVGRGSIYFDGVRVPAAHRLGDEGQGFVQVMQGFDFSRALIGLQCLAVARASLDETWRYATERRTMGVPIGQHQGVSFPLAEAETHYDAARWQCLRTLWLKDHGHDHTAQAAMCKWWAPKLSYEIVQQCLLTHGHGGYSSEYPYEQRMRDVFGLQIGDGTAQIMKLVIARHFLRALGE